jgi:hypothetical protein
MPDGSEFHIGNGYGNLYRLNTVEYANLCHFDRHESPTLNTWHLRLGHLHQNAVKMLFDKGMATKGSYTGREIEKCVGCVLGKQHRDSFPTKSGRRATKLLEIVHTDVFGPTQVASMGKSRYFVTFIDDFSRYVYVYTLQAKSQVFGVLKEYVAMVENQTGNKVKCLRSDNGGEYTSKAVESFLKAKGIVHETTIPNTSEQNGVAERMNRTLMENARSMLCHAQLPRKFWAEAVSTAAFLRNRSPTVAVPEKTPFERWFGYKPSLNYLRVFGCDAYAHIAKGKRRKLDPKATRCIMVGYCSGSKGYRLWDVEKQCIVNRRDVSFFENAFTRDKMSGKNVEETYGFANLPDLPGETEKEPENAVPGLDEVVNDEVPANQGENAEEEGDPGGENDVESEYGSVDSDSDDTVQEEPVNLPEDGQNQAGVAPPVGAIFRDPKIDVQNIVQGQRIRKQPDRFEASGKVAKSVVRSIEPKTIAEAWNGKDGDLWKKATDDEYEALQKNGTYKLVPLPKGRKVVGCKWVFAIKRKPDGSVGRYKARIVVQGFSQERGIDYNEVYAPVARGNTIRTVLALSNHLDWEVHHMDVKTAFLNGDIDSEVYVKQFPGYEDKDHPDYVCKLEKNLYGLKQGARCWNSKFDEYVQKIGYKKCSSEACVYVKTRKDAKSGAESRLILVLYVDDILLASGDLGMIEDEKVLLKKGFEMEDLGEAHFILGMSIKRDRKKRLLTIDQKQYLLDILDRFGMTDCNPIDTPLEPGKRYDRLKPGEAGADEKRFQAIIGCLTFAMTATRPDLSAAVGALSQFMAAPSQEHMGAAKRILRYVKRTLDYGLTFDGTGGSILTGYSDADWAGDLVERRSTSGYTFQFCGGTISWSSKRQSVVARSSTEAEYIAMSQAAAEAVWLRRFLRDLGFAQSSPTTIYADNLSAMALSRNPLFHNRTKHIDVQYHYIRECVLNTIIEPVHVSSEEMVADVLTKGLARPKFRYFCGKLCVGSVFLP